MFISDLEVLKIDVSFPPRIILNNHRCLRITKFLEINPEESTKVQAVRYILKFISSRNILFLGIDLGNQLEVQFDFKRNIALLAQYC